MGARGIRSLIGLAREARASSGEERTLVLAGARELVPLLAKELRAGGDAAAVAEHGHDERAAGIVWIGPTDEQALRAAARTGLPLVALSDATCWMSRYVLDSERRAARILERSAARRGRVSADGSRGRYSGPVTAPGSPRKPSRAAHGRAVEEL